MGWSCSQYADDTLNEIQKLLDTTYNFDISNKISKDKFFEISRKEHIDGKITGSIYSMIDCQRLGSFCIGSNGYIKRFDYLPRHIKKTINQSIQNNGG
tara:strand:+ start:564 stop:857 length:294 start_codon:yes stop_codon:yes gene_type:complete